MKAGQNKTDDAEEDAKIGKDLDRHTDVDEMVSYTQRFFNPLKF